MSAAPRAWDALARAAAAREANEETRALRELLVFTLDGTHYALPIERVREIVRPRALTPVPRVPAVVLGVISLRGEIVQVIDGRRRLALAPIEIQRKSRVVVLNGEGGEVTGLLVDSVQEVLRVEESALRSSAAGEDGLVTALAPRGAQFVSLLATDRLVAIDDAA
jgi:purine-binding chemotaxis protein CheW